MQTKTMLGIGLGLAFLIVASAVTSAMVTRHSMASEEQVVQTSSVKETVVEPARETHHKARHASTRHENINWNDNRAAAAAPAPAPAQPVQVACNDNNIVGDVVGGVAGGVLGSQIGKGSGKTAATIAGTMGGVAAGNELIPTRNVTCR